MKLSNDKTEVMKQILAAFTEGRAEALSFAGERGTWVVCFRNDGLPMRKNEQGHIGAMVGGNIWTTTDMKAATRLMVALDKKAEKPNTIVTMEAADWSAMRVAQYDEMIATNRKLAEANGITL